MWLVLANTGSKQVTGMSQVTNTVVDVLQASATGPLRVLPTDCLDAQASLLGRLARVPGLWYRTLRLLPQTEIVYTTLSASWPGIVKNLVVLAPVLLAGKKLVLHSHSGGFRRFYLGRRRWQRLLIRGLVDRATRILVVHRYYRKHFRFSATPVFELVNCSDDLGIAPPPAERQRVRLLYFGHLMRAKGVAEILSAMQVLANSGLRAQLRIAGANFDIGPLALQPNEAPGSAIDYRGVVRGFEDRRRLFANVDLLVLPTRYRDEALPLVVLEALSTGTPVLCTPWRALGEVIVPGYNGWHCDPDAPSIAAAVRHYATLPAHEVDAIRRNCRADWERHYTQALFASRLAQVLTNVS